jgi:hypothetical protein
MNTTSDATATGLSTHQAASEIASLLSVDDGTQDGGEVAGDGEEVEEADTNAENAEEAEDGGEADEGDESESNSDEEDDDGEPAPELPDDTVVKVGDEEVTLHELKRGFFREADYTRKTMALAEERRVHQEAARAEVEGLRNERAAYVQQLGEVQQVLASLKPQEPNWTELYQNDPARYAAERELHRSFQEQNTLLEVERQKAAQQATEEYQRELKAFVAAEAVKLKEKLPEWSKKEVRDAFVKWGTENGFAAEELAQITDHRAIITAHKARLYDELMAKKKDLKPTPAKPGQPKTAKPGNASTAPNKHSDATRARQRLAKTGKVNDAAAAMFHLLPD